MDIVEYKNAKTSHLGKPAFQHRAESSWTPSPTISKGFAFDAGRERPSKKGAHVSAWVHENDIALMPNQYASSKGSDEYKYEQEVIVKPGGISPLVHKDDVAKLTGVDKDNKHTHPGGQILDNPDRMINFRQKSQESFGGDPIARNKYIMPEFKRNRFKKSQLAKSPIKYEGELFNHPQQVKTSEEKPFVNEKTTQALPNGLTHKILHGDQKTIHELYDKDKLVGTLTVVNNQVRDSQVSSEEQGRNYGKSLYSAALRHHGQLESDTLVSPAAAHQW